MMLSDGLILTGYPGSRKIKRESNQSTACNEEILQIALGIILNAGNKVNGTQLEFLKGALAQFQHHQNSNKSLLTAVEQILTTVTNSYWVDREIMRMFFLETAGFGSELSLSCANLCIDRGIPSPQQLAAFIHASSANDVLQWLKINQTHFMLLKIAVGSYLIEIQKACCACGVSTNMPAVWVDVDTPVVSTDGEGVEGAQEEEVKVERAMSGDHFDGAKPTMPEHSLLNNKDSSSCDQQDRPGTACGAYDWEGSSLSSYDHQQLTLTSTQMVDPCAEVSPLLTPASAVASAANSPLDFYAEAPWERSESSGSWVSGSLLSPAGRISSNNSWASCAFAGDHSVSVGKGKEDIAVDVEADDEVEVEVGMVAESVWWEEGPSFTASSALLDTSARYTADAQLQVAAQLPTAVEDSATALTVAVPTPVRSALRVV